MGLKGGQHRKPWSNDDDIRISYDAQADNKALYDSIARQRDVLGVKWSLLLSLNGVYGKMGFAGYGAPATPGIS